MDNRRRSGHSAFTLVELLVVIAIVGILVALLLPAVQAAREAARRMQCITNMKNVALAAINHHDTYGHFPVDEDYWKGTGVQKVNVNNQTFTWQGRTPDSLPKGGLDGGGWIVRVLPFLEESVLYDQFDIADRGINGAWNERARLGMNNTGDLNFAAAVQSQPKVLQCPSDTFAGPQLNQWPYSDGVLVPNARNIAVATTSYKGNAGDGVFEREPTPLQDWTYSPRFSCYSGDDCVGIFWRTTYIRGGVKLKQISDGTSKTFLIGESSPVDLNSAAWSSDGDWAVTSIEINFDYEKDNRCKDSTGVVNVGQDPCWGLMRGFRSFHPGGVNFAYADGSVSFVNESIEHRVYRALSTRQIGETVSQ